MQKKAGTLLIRILCALLVIAAAVIVRVPAVSLESISPEAQSAYLSEEGLPFLSEMDSYYHVRITDNYLDHAALGDAASAEGTDWDTQRYYPEGRSAEYQPGIVWVTAAVSRISSLFGITLYQIEFWLSAVMAAFTALAVFFFTRRISSTIGGLTAGILVSCGAAFVERTLPGRFDTDMFVLLLDVLTIFTFTEAMRSARWLRKIVFSAAFAGSVLLYSCFWSSTSAFLFSSLNLAGGLLFLILLFCSFHKSACFTEPPGQKSRGVEESSPIVQNVGFAELPEQKSRGVGESSPTNQNVGSSRIRWFFRQSEVQLFLILCLLLFAVIFALKGPAFFEKLVNDTLSAQSLTQSGTLPNLYASVSELKAPAFFPSDPAGLLGIGVPGQKMTVIGGIGGIIAALLCVAGLVILITHILSADHVKKKTCQPEGFGTGRRKVPADSGGSYRQETGNRVRHCRRRWDALYFCVLFLWLLGCLYAACKGTRFIEHLSVPVSILAGIFIGRVLPDPFRGKPLEKAIKIVIPLLLCVAAVLSPILGAYRISSGNRPSVSVAQEEAMQWIRENAAEDAVITSWWDNGYYYEYASARPALWDGGCQTWQRGILLGKVLAGTDLKLSGNILKMLAWSGDTALNFLLPYLEPSAAFELLWEALSNPDSESTWYTLYEDYAFPAMAAYYMTYLLCPGASQEIYLILTGTMMKQLGWFEYYADWNFQETAAAPVSTLYNKTPDGKATIESEDEAVQAFFDARAGETIWKLFFYHAGGDRFSLVYETDDGVEQVQVWKVE